MQEEQKSEKKQNAETFAQLFGAFGESIGKVLDDSALKKKTKEFCDDVAGSAKTMTNLLKDEEVKAKFRDVGKAAEEFSKSVADYFKKEKKE